MTREDFEKITGLNVGIVDLTDNGRCTGCGSCCSNFLPLTKAEIGVIKRYVKKHRIKPSIVTADIRSKITCPFLDVTKGKDKCKIYEVRPLICRDFLCAKNCSMETMQYMKNERFGYDVREIIFGKGENK